VKDEQNMEIAAAVSSGAVAQNARTYHRVTDLRARGEPFTWVLGGALCLGIVMIVGFLLLVLWNGFLTFVPRPVAVVTTTAGKVSAGEVSRTDTFRPAPDALAKLSPDVQEKIKKNEGFAGRTLYRIGNFDLYSEDFRWIDDNDRVPEELRLRRAPGMGPVHRYGEGHHPGWKAGRRDGFFGTRGRCGLQRGSGAREAHSPTRAR
jgi:ABC-type phosphate transport system auxiliary subunit